MRGTVSIKQLEGAHIVAHAKISLPERQRKHYEGTSCGDTLTGVVMPDMVEEWNVTWKQKKDLLGKKEPHPRRRQVRAARGAAGSGAPDGYHAGPSVLSANAGDVLHRTPVAFSASW